MARSCSRWQQAGGLVAAVQQGREAGLEGGQGPGEAAGEGAPGPEQAGHVPDAVLPVPGGPGAGAGGGAGVGLGGGADEVVAVEAEVGGAVAVQAGQGAAEVCEEAGAAPAGLDGLQAEEVVAHGQHPGQPDDAGGGQGPQPPSLGLEHATAGGLVEGAAAVAQLQQAGLGDVASSDPPGGEHPRARGGLDGAGVGRGDHRESSRSSPSAASSMMSMTRSKPSGPP